MDGHRRCADLGRSGRQGKPGSCDIAADSPFKRPARRNPGPPPRGIRVNAVAPGPVWSPLNPSDKTAEDVAQFGAQVPMKRPAQPEEIAPAFVFLASRQCSSYITGEVLPIIGGY